MNAATRVLSDYLTGDGSDEVNRDRLIFKLASITMSTTDDATRPMTRTLRYLEDNFPGRAVNELKVRYSGILNAEASR